MSGPGAIGYAFCVQALNKSLQQFDIQISVLSSRSNRSGEGTWHGDLEA